MPTRSALSIIIFAAMFAYGSILFSDGLTIAQTQAELKKAVEANPDGYLQLASDPLYQPLFISYQREVQLLHVYLTAEDQPAASMKLKGSPLFAELLKTHQVDKQQEAARRLFLRFAQPTVDGTLAYTYETGRTISESLGIQLPPLKVS